MTGEGLALTELAQRGQPPDPATAALIARMSAAPDGARRSLIDATVRALRASGVWAKLDGCWVMAAHDSQAARLNWVSASYTLSAIGTPGFTVDRGFQGDGVGSALDTGLVPGAGQTLQDSHHLSIWPLTEGNFAGAEVGAENLTLSARNGEILLSRSSSLNFTTMANSIAVAHLALSRTDATGYALYRGGALLGNAVQASSPYPGVYPLYLCGRNAIVPGGAPGFNARQLALVTVGGGLSGAEQAALTAAFAAYLAAIGAA